MYMMEVCVVVVVLFELLLWMFYVNDVCVIFGVCVVFLLVLVIVQVFVFEQFFLLKQLVLIVFGQVDMVVLLQSNGEVVWVLIVGVVLQVLFGVGYYDFFVVCILIGQQWLQDLCRMLVLKVQIYVYVVDVVI